MKSCRVCLSTGKIAGGWTCCWCLGTGNRQTDESVAWGWRVLAPKEEPELSPRAQEILKLLQVDLAHLNCDCGAEKVQTTHSDWCSSRELR